jgi:hypothetical protein
VHLGLCLCCTNSLLEGEQRGMRQIGSGDEQAGMVAGSEAPLLTALEKRFAGRAIRDLYRRELLVTA